MYKVVIADDEQMIREGLKLLIDWKSLNLVLVGEAEDGLSALRLVERHKPHILVTDVKMPGMSGLEVIRKINESGMDIRNIIISGYDDFLYVKEALRYGVADYILKPVREDDLVSILKEVVSNIENRIKIDLDNSESTNLIRSNLLNRLIGSCVTRVEFLEKTKFLKLDISDKPYSVMIAEIDGNRLLSNAELEYKLNVISRICEDIFQNFEYTMAFHDKSNRLVIIINDDEIGQHYLKLVAEEIRDRVRKLFDFTVSIGIGGKAQNIMMVDKSYNEAVNALQQKYLKGGNSVNLIQEDNNPSTAYRDIADTGRIEMSVNQLNFENAEKEIYLFFDELLGKTSNIAYIRKVCIDLLLLMMSIMKEHNGRNEDLLEDEELVFDRVSSAETIEDARNALVDFAKKLVNYLSGIKSDVSNKVVNEIIDYVKSAYNKNITLKSVAQRFYMNPAYLGRIFKDETGEFFSDFVNRIRIHEAGKLMLDSDMKIYEIAEKCGYKDINYFRDLFKKITGINPMEFKKK